MTFFFFFDSFDRYLSRTNRSPKVPWGRSLSYGGFGPIQLPKEHRPKQEPPTRVQKGHRHYGGGVMPFPRWAKLFDVKTRIEAFLGLPAFQCRVLVANPYSIRVWLEACCKLALGSRSTRKKLQICWKQRKITEIKKISEKNHSFTRRQFWFLGRQGMASCGKVKLPPV